MRRSAASSTDVTSSRRVPVAPRSRLGGPDLRVAHLDLREGARLGAHRLDLEHQRAAAQDDLEVNPNPSPALASPLTIAA
jgi:hypothetical protein